MRISEFDFELPEELVAQEPPAGRGDSRMLILDRNNRQLIDSQFRSLSDYLQPNDVVVLNNTRVFPARLRGQRDPSGGQVEVLLVREVKPLLWEAMVRPGSRLNPGAWIRFGNAALRAQVVEVSTSGLRILRFQCDQSFERIIDEIGETPLPPYIKRPLGTTPADRERYQTIYASSKGAIAAPTAGLHFTVNTLNELRARGVKTLELTLHVGYGTFEPVHVDDIDEHQVAPERLEITAEVAGTLNEARSQGARVVAIGTTTVRALESATNVAGLIESGWRNADRTLLPGYKFRAVDALLTNFHLPRSSLLLLVCAFAGREFVLEAYRHAVAARYRFYSYGDCMLII